MKSLVNRVVGSLCGNKSLKIHFSSEFLLTLSIYFILGEIKSNIGMSIYCYLFPMYLLRKTFLFFSFSSMLYFDSL